MKPEFALSLSFDGIRLLHRAAGGWREVGAVDVDSADLAADLAALRKQAANVKLKRVRTKLILPEAQIKYLTIDTGDVDDAARRAAAEVALDGATPYAVDALAFDISAEGPKTHIAAVARETLAEAEAFAVEHNFKPVSFVAAPESAGFLGEPFFGQTEFANTSLRKGIKVVPDGIRVVVVSHPDPEDADAAPDAPDAEAATDGPEAEAPAEPAVTEDDTTQDASQPETDPAEDADAQAKAAEETPPEPADAAASTVEAPDDIQDAPASEAEDDSAAAQPDNDAPKSDAPTSTAAKPAPEPDEDKPDENEEAAAPAPVEDARPKEPKDDTAADAPVAAKADTGAATENGGDESALMGFATRRHANGNDPGASPAPLGGVTREPPTSRPAARLSISDPTASAPPPPPSLSPQQVAAQSLRAAPPIEDLPPPRVTPSPADTPKSGGFLSRRKPKRVPPAPPSGTPAQGASAAAARTAERTTNPTDAEAQRMTVFGARADVQVGGKPRFLGLILTAILLVFLAGVAAWASVFLDDGLAKFFPKRERTLASTLPTDAERALAEDVGATVELEPTEGSGDELIVASLNEGLSDGLTPEDAAVLDALRNPQPDPAAQQEIDSAALEARYAVTGIWPKAPQIPPEPSGLIVLEDLYVTGIDPVSPALDAIALPDTSSFLTDVSLPDIASPPAPGTRFALDDNGRVVPTEDGALSPDGFTVYLGRPDIVPPSNPREAAEPAPEADDTPDTRRLAAERPRARPDDLVEQNERATLGGLSRSELALLRPQLRPAAPQEVEAAEAPEPAAPEAPAPVEAISPLATAESFRPQTRPRNFDRVVARATRAAPAPQRVAAVAPRTVTPSIPSSASVTREATVRNAINLSRVNLIGVYGTPSNRRALVRLKSGRYQKVKVGDRFDGGRVSAIGDSELRYQKGSRNLVLKMPN